MNYLLVKKEFLDSVVYIDNVFQIVSIFRQFDDCQAEPRSIDNIAATHLHDRALSQLLSVPVTVIEISRNGSGNRSFYSWIVYNSYADDTFGVPCATIGVMYAMFGVGEWWRVGGVVSGKECVKGVCGGIS